MTELAQTLVNAVLLIAVTLIAGSIGLKRFEAIDRRFDAVDRRFEAIDGRFDAVDRKFDDRFDAVDRKFDDRFDAVDRKFDDLRTELKADIARVDGHVADLRSEVAQVRSDLTYVALAVGARRAEDSG